MARSFSLSLRNQGEPGSQGAQEPMRIRSATTSGAPGVEKARDSVRQKASGKHEEIFFMVVLFQLMLYRNSMMLNILFI